MKNLDLNNYGVQEMNAEEMAEKNGGMILILAMIIGFAVGAFIKSLE